MKSESVLLTVAIVAVIVSMAGLYITYDSINLVKQKITGLAVEEGQVNITIESLFSVFVISFEFLLSTSFISCLKRLANFLSFIGFNPLFSTTIIFVIFSKTTEYATGLITNEVV